METLSICITIKNRSRVILDEHTLYLFPNCIISLVKAASNLPCKCELIVTDRQSDDWPLQDWLYKAVGSIPTKIIQIKEEYFSRGKGLNIATQESKGEWLFYMDADMLVPAALLESGINYLKQNRAFFPICWSFKNPEHSEGWKRVSGYGNCMVTRAMYDKVGGWPEYTTWGGEDTDFFKALSSQGEVIREPHRGLFHQWHPQDPEWKQRYYGKKNPGCGQ